MENIKLTPRLELAAGMVRKGSVVCDVGTDHAYLPSYLLQQAVVNRAIAADIAQQPLMKAQKTITKFGLGNCITTVLSDGLQEINPIDVDDIVICGMGGESIINILSGVNWIKNKKFNLILQPMSRAEELRKFLYQEGFSITKEFAVVEDKHVYTVINAAYSDNKVELSALNCYIGKLEENINDAAKEYIKKQIRRLQKKVDGLSYNIKSENNISELISVIHQMEQFI